MGGRLLKEAQGAPRDTIRLAYLAIECGLFPLFEAEHGRVTRSHKIRRQVPVEAYLKPQKRFAHLFGRDGDDHERIAEIHNRLADIDAHSAPARAASILAGLGFDEAEQCGQWRAQFVRDIRHEV